MGLQGRRFAGLLLFARVHYGQEGGREFELSDRGSFAFYEGALRPGGRGGSLSSAIASLMHPTAYATFCPLSSPLPSAFKDVISHFNPIPLVVSKLMLDMRDKCLSSRLALSQLSPNIPSKPQHLAQDL